MDTGSPNKIPQFERLLWNCAEKYIYVWLQMLTKDRGTRNTQFGLTKEDDLEMYLRNLHMLYQINALFDFNVAVHNSDYDQVY